eukprot:TRINITY_DN476_c0_g1_i1.p1 TRINITY_DN476_c0_g1~~TRINITY_DN476_c0_g1_i1.p1  ORF type:complete len:1111 (+),score=101.91 TRINITY_DN476_c0_g1_i1:992-4324(+)
MWNASELRALLQQPRQGYREVTGPMDRLTHSLANASSEEHTIDQTDIQGQGDRSTDDASFARRGRMGYLGQLLKSTPCKPKLWEEERAVVRMGCLGETCSPACMPPVRQTHAPTPPPRKPSKSFRFPLLLHLRYFASCLQFSLHQLCISLLFLKLPDQCLPPSWAARGTSRHARSRIYSALRPFLSNLFSALKPCVLLRPQSSLRPSRHTCRPIRFIAWQRDSCVPSLFSGILLLVLLLAGSPEEIQGSRVREPADHSGNIDVSPYQPHGVQVMKPFAASSLQFSSDDSDQLARRQPTDYHRESDIIGLPLEQEERSKGSGPRRRLLWKYNNVDSKFVEEPAVSLQPPDIASLIATLGRPTDNPDPFQGNLKLEIFCAPRPFTGLDSDPQLYAIRSWMRLRPIPRVVLLGNHPSFEQVAQGFRKKAVTVDSRVDCNSNGVPLFNSMVARAQASKLPYSMVIGSDVLLTSDLLNALTFVKDTFSFFTMIAAQTEMARIPRPLFSITRQRVFEARLGEFVQEHGRRSPHPRAAFWLWNNSPVPLHNSSMPPFVYRRGRHDRWLARDILATGYRALVDASDLVTAINLKVVRTTTFLPFAGSKKRSRGPRGEASMGERSGDEVAEEGSYMEHDGGETGGDEVQGGRKTVETVEDIEEGGSGQGATAGDKTDEMESKVKVKRWYTEEASVQEFWANRHMAEEFSKLTQNAASADRQDGLWRVGRCLQEQEKGSSFCHEAIDCWNSSGSASSTSNFRDPAKNQSGAQWICRHVAPEPVRGRAVTSLHSKSSVAVPDFAKLEDLLPMVADQNNVVTLVAVTSDYKEMLMSFVCNLRRLNLPMPLLAALDPGVYEFGVEQGLAVFFDPSAHSIHLEHAKNGSSCEFSTPCFMKVTKLKSRVVLSVLKLGYNVLWSDVDIVWFRDPRLEILAYPQDVFPVQSDQPRRKDPPNGRDGYAILGGSINSGFYFARAQPKIIEAFTAIVADAYKTNTSEQPSFYRVLCGNGNFTVGSNDCVWPQNGLQTVFMPRALHPNGKVYFYWYGARAAEKCVSRGCATLHNNWIKGRERKIERARRMHLWYYDAGNRMCMYTWYRETQGLPLISSEETDAAKKEYGGD